MDPYFITLLILGAAMLSAAWVPTILRYFSISYSICYLLLGVIIYLDVDEVPLPDPLWEEGYSIHLTELAVIIALMAAGIGIDKTFSLRGWKMPLRLVSVTMVLSIAAMAGIGVFLLGFDLPSAILLGAVLAPTDPVLSGDVQVAGPNEGDEDEMHFALTAEAGINDGAAFPFTWLAIALALGAGTSEGIIVDWLLNDLLYKIIAGILIGVVVGRVCFYLFFKLPERKQLFKVQMGFVGIAITLFVYALAELVLAYGFVAVFIAAVTLRNREIKHHYHEELHHFTQQVEHLLMVILLILFGGSLVHGILDHLTWPMALAGITFILIIRPLSALAGLLGIPLQMKRKLVISFFGIRGIGSFFYLSFALSKADFPNKDELWSMVAFIVLISIVIHGATVARSVRWVTRKPN